MSNFKAPTVHNHKGTFLSVKCFWTSRDF